MNTLRAAAQQVFDRAKWINEEQAVVSSHLLTALRAALSEPEQEPVAWRYLYSDGFWRFLNGARVNGCDPVEAQPLYTHPAPQRKPLTDEQRVNLVLSWGFGPNHPDRDSALGIVASVERAHGIGGEA